MEFKITINGKRHKFGGYPDEATMEEAKNNLNALIEAKKEEKTPETSVRKWRDGLANSNPNHYNRLVELGLAEALVKPGTLGELIDIFMKSDADTIKPQTIANRQCCCNALCDFFGTKKPVTSIKLKDAKELWQYMKKRYRRGTYERQIKTVKQIFNVAIEEKWISENPITLLMRKLKLKSTNSVNKDRVATITRKMADKVMEACPNAYWRLIFALARYGGLRIPSELRYLKWSDIFWDYGKIRISIPKKTGKDETPVTRYIPIFPELKKALDEYLESLPEGCPDLFFPEIGEGKNLRTELECIILHAGLTPWPKLFINLRSTRASELMKEHPQYLVCKWMGHTSAVFLKHYAQDTDEDYIQASYLSSSAPPKPAPVSSEGTPKGTLGMMQSFLNKCKFLQFKSLAPIFKDFLQETENPYIDLHGNHVPPDR